MNLNETCNIFLADDDEDDTFLFQEALGQIPVKTDLVIAENGMELMKKLGSTEQVPDLIFLDMNMPVKNGMECLHELRRSEMYNETPVVILSTSVAGYLLEDAYNAGANLYIQKPTSFSNLVTILKKCLLKKSNLINRPELSEFLIANE
ncbi:Response regulator receiver domain-containing protein [Dyadobacter koreensis]|uniref:Response regulator receiver domain-containing protein n=1 Tax=Dyadobacter koreensis TaxID=408657 RepID=A0A1H7B530_9BACT|nr:response regulator [Dyadobacter koreensis]SEJ72014.1 Response regulator receiver domain-containing protein [Dyadobacter koreensis]